KGRDNMQQSFGCGSVKDSSLMIVESVHRSARQQVSSLVTVFTAAVLLAGCAVGPDYRRPSAPSVEHYTVQPLPSQTASVEIPGGEAQRFVENMDIPGQWWTLFHSKPLDDLIEQALKANPDLEV